MSLKGIKSNNQGFTIVELLIVVVVIAILAAITIVSYNGITNRANASAAASTAASVQKKAELYASDDDSTTGYPKGLNILTDATKSAKPYYIASGTIDVVATPDSGNGKKSVKLEVCGTPTASAASAKTAVSGLIISYFAYDGTTTLKTIKVGDTSAGCAVAAS